MTKSDAWRARPVVLNYWEFKKDLEKEARRAGYEIEDQLDIVFVVAMPQSWSNKQKSSKCGTPHQSKPDTDNFLKAFCDCLTDNDSAIWDMRGRKFWGIEGAIIVL